MIWESDKWKSDLIKDADILQRWAKKKPSSRQAVLFEKKIMISAYTIRKLIEAEKIGPDIKDEYWNIEIKKFTKNNNEKQINLLNWHHIDKHYNLNDSFSTKNKTTLIKICNLIIHSYIFCLSHDNENFVDGFFVTSDHEKENNLYWIKLDTFITLITEIGYLDIHELTMTENKRKPSGWTIKREYVYK